MSSGGKAWQTVLPVLPSCCSPPLFHACEGRTVRLPSDLCCLSWGRRFRSKWKTGAEEQTTTAGCVCHYLGGNARLPVLKVILKKGKSESDLLHSSLSLSFFFFLSNSFQMCWHPFSCLSMRLKSFSEDSALCLVQQSNPWHILRFV